jgi:TolB-like protein/DNA-binding winged helix-turn-helix (wHTH) protein/Tfp pilus assembly protein PilF
LGVPVEGEREAVPAFRAYSFGEYTLDLRRGALVQNGLDVRLRPKSYEVLRFLVERHGQLVSKEELLDGVWGRSVVTDASITQCLIDIRRAIGDDSQRVIRTVQRRGYIFDAVVVEADGAAAAPRVEPPPPVGGGSSRPGRSGTGARMWLAVVVLVPALIVVWIGLRREPWSARESGEARESPQTAATERSIAVLPFADLSPGRDQQYLADGIAEEILDRLAGMRALRVIARTSAFSFRDRPADIPTIAARLRVSHVLEGSVRRAGDHLRITAQLVDVASNSHVWSKTYDRDLGDLFAVQDEVAGSVAVALEESLAGSGLHALPPALGPAYERFLQGQFFFKRRSPGDVARAAKYFEDAVAIDPGFARAWAALSGACGILAWDGDRTSDWRARRGEAARRAVELAPDSVEARIRLASYFYESGRLEEALAEYRRAYELDPGDHWLASFSDGFPQWRDGDLDAVIKDERSQAERDPLSPTARMNLGLSLFAAGYLDDALAEFRSALEINPDLGAEVELEIGRVLVAQRRYPEAYAAIRQLQDSELRDSGISLLIDTPEHRRDAEAALARLVMRPGDYMHDLRIAEALAQRGRDDDAFGALQHARDGLEQGPELMARIWYLQNEMFHSPFLKSLHSDPRWASLMAVPG